MALKEVVSQEDLILYEIMRNPVLFTEFIQNIDKSPMEEPFELTIYQKEILCDFNSYVDMCCARAVGKTVSLSAIIIWMMTYKLFDDYIVFTVPNKVHLDPVFSNLIRMYRSNSFLKHFIRANGGINSGEFKIELLNNAQLFCRIAGTSGTGANVIGLHTPIVLLDEAGYYPWGTWIELQPILNTWVPGFKMMVSGVPTGLRENNVLYHTDQENSNYTKHRVTSFENPRFGPEDEQRAIDQYGGKESDDYMHFVLGKHGKPVFALFDRSTFEISNYATYKMQFNGIEMKENIAGYINHLSSFPGLPNKKFKVILGIDLGYTEPTAIVIMYIDDHGQLKFHGRIRLDKVSYPIQERIIDYLDTKFEPAIIGIDRGSAGISVVQRLTEGAEYIHKNYSKRLVPVDFSSWITLGIDSNGEEIKSKTKPFSISVLQDYTNNHKIIYTSTDLEMVSELERMTYSRTSTGEIIYKTLTPKGGKRGEDHFTAALLCGVLGYYLNNEYILNQQQRKKLAGFFWLGQ